MIAVTIIVLVIAAGAYGFSEAKRARNKAYDVASRHNIKQLATGIINYAAQHQEYPDSLEPIKVTMEAGGVSFSSTMNNPLTKDSPGYEYVKPATKWMEEDPDQIIVIYQLRNGVRALDLAVGYASGSARDMGPSKQ